MHRIAVAVCVRWCVAALALGLAGPARAEPAVEQTAFALVNNHVYVAVELNGKGPFHFIVDSGASDLIDPAVAAAVDAPVRGHLRIAGVGDGTERAQTAVVDRVTIGTAAFERLHFIVAPARDGFGAAEGPPVDGLIGSDVLQRGPVTFDYARRVLTFHVGDAPVNAGVVLPATFAGGVPHVPCNVAGVRGTCAIDTGSRLSATIPAPFADAHPEIVPAQRSAVGVDGYGIGGSALGRLGRLATLDLGGGLVLRDVIADFSVQRKGAFATRETSANLGGGIWRRFALTLDYPHHRVVLLPNAAFGEPDAYDRSGVFLIARNGGIAIADVRPGTPAERAGLTTADRIVAAGGRAVEAADIPDVRAVLSGPPGSVARLVVMRAGEPQRSVDLVLAEYV